MVVTLNASWSAVPRRDLGHVLHNLLQLSGDRCHGFLHCGHATSQACNIALHSLRGAMAIVIYALTKLGVVIRQSVY